ncbi:hypothetical protein PMI42_07941 [Bradyrhizobium sp. YR681]|uniref:hypothetical protein n=1 Tax=Bradyrhizobium sp. YR681 TaxID=1144344 RepID=UPI00026F51E4|nr:hypothetical protein [Bradyrhizobium sp. YR681]EJN07229.1 hypothetical protein PMI42_07941 [Bradyrhizobium sp. YR681]
MRGLLQNLAHLGRGEPIPGAARVALPPRFAAPVRNDDRPQLETWSGEGQRPVPPQTAMHDVAADGPRTEAHPPQHIKVESDSTESLLRPTTKTEAAVRPVHSNEAPSGPPADTALPVAPHHPPRVAQPREVAVPDTLRPPHEATTPPAPPLGQAVLAGQAQRRRETPPVIKVTIDRIDIRSPEPPRPTRSVRPAPQPSVSLTDYLRRPGPGGRA